VARETQMAELPTIDEQHLKALSRYHWPGNVRELRNVIERSLITWKGGRLNLLIEGKEDIAQGPGILIDYAVGKTLRDAHQEVTKYFMDETLRHCNGEKGKAANLLGISRDAFYRYSKKLDVMS